MAEETTAHMDAALPWMNFSINLTQAPARLWVLLGECKALCEFIAGMPISPTYQSELLKEYHTLGTLHATTLDGNTLTAQEVRDILFGGLELPPSKEYLGQENLNMLAGFALILDRIAENPDTLLSSSSIRECNRLALDRLVFEAGIEPGQFRRGPVTLPSHRYQVPPAEECPELLDRLCDWLSSDTFEAPAGMEIVYGILRAIIANLYLTWIHPFEKGNDRTKTLVEFFLLTRAGVPSIAAHHFSRLFVQTRYDYFRHLETASSPKGKLTPFILYSVQGFLDGLGNQVESIRSYQARTTWEHHVSGRFGDRTSIADLRRRQLVLDLTGRDMPVPVSAIPDLSPQLARFYSTKTSKTLSRDLADLEAEGLLERTRQGVRVRIGVVRAFTTPETSAALAALVRRGK